MVWHFRLSVCLYACMYECLYFCLSIRLSVCLSICLSVFLPLSVVLLMRLRPNEKTYQCPIWYNQMTLEPRLFVLYRQRGAGEIAIEAFGIA